MNYDIIIVGGGMVGQAFALSLQGNTQLKIAIIEAHNPNPKLTKKFAIRVSAITSKSEHFLQKIGAWDLLERKCAFTSTKVWDENSHGNLNFFAKDEKRDNLGHIIENDLIQSALFAALKNTKTTFIDDKVISLKKIKQGYQLNLPNNKKMTCDLLVGADGANSQIRDWAGIKFSRHDYQQKAIICNVESGKSFENTIWQRFLSTSIIALLPLNDRQAAVVFSAQNALADELMNLSAKAFATRLSEGVEYRFGELKLLTKTQAFPLIAKAAKTYVQQNLALIGDAAHNIHPLAGQGVNLGFADAAALTEQITRHIDQSIVYDQVLQQYAKDRRLDNELMAKTMTSINWIYQQNSEPLRWLRGFGMNMIDQTPSLKSFLQKYASGKMNLKWHDIFG